MPIYWVQRSGSLLGARTPEVSNEVYAAIAAAGFFLSGVVAYFFGDEEPQLPSHMILEGWAPCGYPE